MESIVEALAGHLRQKKVDIQLNAGVKEVQGANESKYKKPTVILDSGEAICSDHGETLTSTVSSGISDGLLFSVQSSSLRPRTPWPS